MSDAMNSLYSVILDRKQNKAENSYTCYLFEQGTDKILKKVAEESGEVIIAAKNGDNSATCEEICDLIFHLEVLMAQCGIPLADIEAILAKRAEKQGNLKKMKVTDKNT